jgi:hypothetical protein
MAVSDADSLAPNLIKLLARADVPYGPRYFSRRD